MRATPSPASFRATRPRRSNRKCPAFAAFFKPAAKAGHFLFALRGLVARKLAGLGVARIEIAAADTAADAARFFSYRRSCLKRENGHGLGLSAIALAPG